MSGTVTHLPAHDTASPKAGSLRLSAVALPADDVALCLRLLGAGSKSFASAARLLPSRLRAPAAVFYAFCRQADDAVDEVGADPSHAVVALGARLDRVYAWSRDLNLIPQGPLQDSVQAVDRSLAIVVHNHALPRSVFDALIEGFLWDAQDRRYHSYDELVAYCARVASTVGVVMTLMMGTRDIVVLARACELGLAMQLTNIARDVGEDARRGRIYLPQAWLDEVALDRQTLLESPTLTPALAKVIARLLRHADEAYRGAELGIAGLPRDCRPAIRAARLIYAAIGDQIVHSGYDSVTQRAHTSWWFKLRMLLRARWRPTPGEAFAAASPPELHPALAPLLVDIEGYERLTLRSAALQRS